MATQSTKTSKTKTSKTKKPAAAKKKTTTAKTTKAKAASTAAVKTPSSKVSLLKRDKTKQPKQLTAASLRTWNKWLALLFAAQGVAILFLSTSYSIAVSGSYLAVDTLASKTGDTVRVPALQFLFDANVAYLLAGVCFVFALMSLLVATLYKASYEQALERKVNRFRWTTFSLGFGVSIVVLGLLSGVQDAASLLMLFALTVLVSMSGLGLELLGGQQVARGVVSSIGTIAWLTVWSVLALYFVYAGLYDGSVPDYVYYLAGSMLLLSVMLVSVLRRQQAGQGKWADYLRVERAYLVLSFVFVAALTWQVFVGVLQP